MAVAVNPAGRASAKGGKKKGKVTEPAAGVVLASHVKRSEFNPDEAAAVPVAATVESKAPSGPSGGRSASGGGGSGGGGSRAREGKKPDSSRSKDSGGKSSSFTPTSNRGMSLQLDYELDDKQSELFRTEFALYDKDNSGFITVEEFGTVMRSLGVNMSETELQEMVDTVDRDSDGEISYDEFVMMMRIKMTNQCNEEELAEAFRAFDADESGFVTGEELRNALACLGEDNFSREECNELLKYIDTDGDGRVDYSEFAALLTDPMQT